MDRLERTARAAELVKCGAILVRERERRGTVATEMMGVGGPSRGHAMDGVVILVIREKHRDSSVSLAF